MTEAVYIIDTIRTPVGNLNGILKEFSAPKLGAELIAALLKKHSLSDTAIESVLLGNNVSAGIGQNPARQAATLGGIAPDTDVFSINQVCGSGLKSTCLAASLICAGIHDLLLTGAVESSTHMPYFLPRASYNKESIDPALLVDSLQHDGLRCAFLNKPMGEAAEHVAKTLTLSREELDAFALKSHEKAISAIETDKLKEEIIPITCADHTVVDTDEKPKKNTSLKKLSRLKPVYSEAGTITAGNASGLADAAVMTLLASESFIKQHQITPLACFVDSVTIGTEPIDTFLGISIAIKKLLLKNNLSCDDIDLFEVCESFSSAALGAIKELSLPEEKVNIYGGDVAFGHPFGASGSRILCTLTHALKKKGLSLGVAVIAMGGGHTTAVLIKA